MGAKPKKKTIGKPFRKGKEKFVPDLYVCSTPSGRLAEKHKESGTPNLDFGNNTPDEEQQNGSSDFSSSVEEPTART